MTTTEIKKELYKQKPKAELLYIRNGIAKYDAVIKLNNETFATYKTVFFDVPVSDMGNADFTPIMDAKLLNRWLVEEALIING